MSTRFSNVATALPASGGQVFSVRRLLAAAGAGAVAGLGLWCAFGVLSVEASGSRAIRVGLLPHPGWLVASVVLLAAGAGCLQRFTRLARAGGWYLPLFCGGFAALPWLPGQVPAAMLIWAGPATWWLFGAVLAAIACVVFRAGVYGAPRWGLALLEPRRAPWAAAALAVAIYGAAAVYLAPLFPGGDEPHYLVITQSLLEDGDIRIENNHRQQDYRAYFNAPLEPHYLRRGLDNEIYSVHAPGLPAVLAPAFAIGGYPAVVAFLVGVAAFVSWMTWRAAFLVTGRPGAAWAAWAGVAISSPILLHAFAVYPETTGAALVLTAVVTLLGMDRAHSDAPGGPGIGSDPLAWPWWRWLLVGGALALLPWLHTRYAVLAGVLGAVLGLRLIGGWKRVPALLALFAVPAISAAAWFAFFKVLYGRFDPSAPYGPYTQTRLAYVPRGLSALFFDQQFGLVPNAPVFALAILGFMTLARARRRLAAELLALVLFYASAAGAYAMWWGGWSAPARFLVPVVPVLAVPLAAWWAGRRAGGRLVSAVLLVLTVMASATVSLAGRGELIFNSRDGVSRLFEWLAPLVDLNRSLPSFFRPSQTHPLLIAGMWVALFAAAAAALFWSLRTLGANGAGRREAGVVALAALVVMLGLDAGWRIERARPLASTQSQLALLQRASRGNHRIGVSFQPLRLEPPGKAATRLRLSAPNRRARGEGRPAYAISPVPAGVYRLDEMSVPALTADLDVFIGRGTSPVATWKVGSAVRERERTLRLPCAVNAVVIDSEPSLRDAVGRLALRPVEIWPGTGCGDQRVLRASRYEGGTVFFLDAHAWAEERGFWVRGKAEALVAVNPAPPGPKARFVIEGGAVAVRVRLTSGAWQDEIALASGELRSVEVPVDRRTGAALVRIRPDNGFVPAQVDPANRDGRFLGCWVRVGR